MRKKMVTRTGKRKQENKLEMKEEMFDISDNNKNPAQVTTSTKW